MIYDIRHRTTYTYARVAGVSACLLKVFPRQGEGQTVVSSQLVLDPSADAITEGLCFFGNRTALLTITRPHRALTVETRSRVIVERHETTSLDLSLPWEQVRDLAAMSQSLAPQSPVHFLMGSPKVSPEAAITDYTALSFPSGRSVRAAVKDLTARLHHDFAYDPTATVVSTPAIEAFRARRGVCQDFAHVMIAGLRGLGLPAAYVSGYLRTVPPAGQPRLQGADATHAWVQIWTGPEGGWLGLDPTNDCLVDQDHIIMAVGRDYSDVAPLSGIVVGSGNQSLDVAVDVVPVAT